MSTNPIPPTATIPPTRSFKAWGRSNSRELDKLKSHHDIPRLFMKYVHSLRKEGRGFMGRCPRHQDQNPSFSLYQDGDGTWLYKCFSCNDTGNIFQFLEWLNGTGFSDAVQEVKNFLGCDNDLDANHRPSKPSPELSRKFAYDKAATITRFSEAADYLKIHGVSLDVARAHDVGVDTFRGVGSCVVFPYNDQTAKLRGLQCKEFRHYTERPTADLFYNLGVLDSFEFLVQPEVFITESERDCLTMVSHGFNAISVSSATACLGRDGTLKFRPEDLAKLQEAEEIYLALDQDEAGQKCATALKRALPKAKILSWQYRGEGSRDPKDIGEIYTSDPEHFKARILQLCEEAKTQETPVPAEDPLVEELPDEEKTFPLTDAGNGERLVALHGKNLRYLNDYREWRVWDGSRWNTDKTSQVERLAKDTIRKIMAEAVQVSDGEIRKALAKWSMACESRSRLDNMVALASREEKVSTNSNAFDKSPWLFNCANGTLDLETNTFRPARREDLLSKQSPVAYDSTAICPRFDAFLTEILPSEEIRNFLQASLGYTLSGHAWEKYLWFMIGEKGDNGKTTLLEAIRYVFGEDDYARNMNFNSLLPREGQGPSGDLARLHGVRFVSACESDEGQKLSASVVKRLTGADKITAAFKYRDETEFTPTFKLWLATNHPPRLPADDEALWRRIVRIPFDYSVPLERQDPRLLEKLKAEGPGILNWMFEGWKSYRNEELEPPQEIRVATETYRDESDVCKDFLKERIIADDSDIGSSELYQAFKAWFTMTQSQRQQPMSQKTFSNRMKQLGYKIDRRRNGNFICGVGRLVDTGPDLYSADPFA